MELNEFEIAHDRAGPRGECEPLAERTRGVGAVQEQAADAAGRDDHTIGRKQHGPALGLTKQSGYRIVFDEQATGGDSLDDRDRGDLIDPADQGANDVAAGGVTPGMDDAPTRMCGLEAEDDVV